MKKALSIILVAVTLALCLTGCAMSIQPSDSIHTDVEGVYITIDSVDYSGDKPALKVTWHNESESTIVFGRGYVIEYLDGDEWKNIQISDFAIPEIACMLEPGGEAEQSYTTKYFNMLRSGTYRIKVEFYLQGDEPRSGIAFAKFEQLKQKF